MPTHQTQELDGSVGQALEVALDAIHRARSRPEARRAVIGPGGETLSATDRWLLARLDEAGPLRMSALARWQEVEPSTMTAQVRRLQARGWITRGPDPADRRAVIVALEPSGREVVRHTAAVARQAADRLVATWPEHDRRELARLLVRLAGELDRVPEAVAAEAVTTPLGAAPTPPEEVPTSSEAVPTHR